MAEKLLRRDFMITGAGLPALAAIRQVNAATASKRDNATVQENSRSGTTDWQLEYTKFDEPVTLAAYPLLRNLRSSAIEGFCSRNSVRAGDTLDIMVSMAPAGQFTLDIYRMGHYSGAGARHVASVGPFKASPQPMPMMTIERLRECAWEKSVSLTIPRDWPSGVYLGKLSTLRDFGPQSYVVFVVKSDRNADLLVQTSDLTWNAYNKWPGNNSMYDDGTPEVWYTGPHVRVSFDRPYAKYCQHVDAPGTVGSGSFLLWEYPTVFWLEQQGYDVEYCSNVDLHNDPKVLSRAKVFLSLGHDEYWSRKMLENALEAKDSGLSMAFLSGNTIWGEIEVYPSSITGRDCRAYARKRDFSGDEARLMGSKSHAVGYGDWVVTNSKNWIYQNTGMRDDDRIRGLIGWEYNAKPAEIPGLEVVANGPLWPRDMDGEKNQRHQAVVFQCAKGNWVFNAGTIWWSEGLSAPPGHIPSRNQWFGTFGPDLRVQQITRNVLNRMIKESP